MPDQGHVPGDPAFIMASGDPAQGPEDDRLGQYGEDARILGQLMQADFVARGHYQYGDVDKAVPLEKNSGELARRYRALGGNVKLIIIPGKGHQVCDEFFHCQELVDFVVANGNSTKATP